jgi:hypothetical protein
MRVSGTSPLGWRAVLPRLLNSVIGTKFDVITGYDTPADYLAVERGEVDGSCTTYTTLLATRMNWIEEKKITFLAQFGLETAPGLEAVPIGLDRIRNRDDRRAIDFILSQQEAGGPYLAPPGVPADRLAALEAAFEATVTDAEFIEASKKANLPLLSPINAAAMKTLVQGAYSTPPEVVTRAKALLAQAVVK